MEFHRLASYLHRYTKQMVGVTLGVPTLRKIFDERYYENLDGGILESFGRLFKNRLKLYVYPWREPATGALVTAGNMRVAPHLRHLYQSLVENHLIQGSATSPRPTGTAWCLRRSPTSSGPAGSSRSLDGTREASLEVKTGRWVTIPSELRLLAR